MIKRIPVGGLDARQIMEKFGVSRATAYLAVKRGYVCPNYHEREVTPDPERAEELLHKVVMVAEQTLFRQYKSIANKADARSEVILRLLQLAGHPDFGNTNWMIKVAENTLSTFVRKEHFLARISSPVDRRIIDEVLDPKDLLDILEYDFIQ